MTYKHLAWFAIFALVFVLTPWSPISIFHSNQAHAITCGFGCNTGTNKIYSGFWSTQLMYNNSTNSVQFATTGDSEVQIFSPGTPTTLPPGGIMTITGLFSSSSQSQFATGTGQTLYLIYTLAQTSTPFTVSGQTVQVSSTAAFNVVGNQTIGGTLNVTSTFTAQVNSTFIGSSTFKNNITSTGTIPTVAGCGTGSPSIVGTNNAGIITTGNSTSGKCDLNFATPRFLNPPVCIGGMVGASGTIGAVLPTTASTSFRFTPSSNGQVISYICFGL